VYNRTCQFTKRCVSIQMKNKFIYIVGLIAISAVVVFLGFFAIKKIISSTPSNSGKYIF